MTFTISPTDALLVERAGDASWRVCDSRVTHGPGRFLAFIDEKDSSFEVMQLAEDFTWTTFSTMIEALAHVARTSPALLSVTPSESIEWPW